MLKKINLDKLGMTASSICAIHCLIMPFIIAILPFIGMSFFASNAFEWFILITAFLIALTSLCFGYKIHKQFNPIIIAFVGFVILTITRVFLSFNSHEDLRLAIFLFIGGAFVALAHFINHKLCHSCTICNHGEQ